jgi:succinate dehydrogenase / fumarate reductase flavoprotein subunit
MFERGYANNVGELASRDVVARAELTEINEGRGFEDDHVLLDMRHLGEERITDRLENIIHLSKDFEGVDPLEEPMRVKPGQHYEMGGIETDENGATCIDGLYAAGECACVSVHGANRLGGNALPELIVFGARAGRHAARRDRVEAQIETGPSAKSEPGSVDTPVTPGEVGTPGEDVVADGGDAAADGGALIDAPAREVVERAVERERNYVRRLMERDGTNHAEIRGDLQKSMTDYVNVFREGAGLKQALRDIRECRERYLDVAVSDPSKTYNTDLIQTIETRNLIDLAEALTLSALARTEFRGAHWRKEHQERKDDEWIKHTMVEWRDGRPNLYYKPVLLEGESKTYEPKVRSY